MAAQTLQDFLLIWIDNHIDEEDTDVQQALQRLRTLVDHVILLQRIPDCVKFIEKLKEKKVLIITSTKVGQDLVPQIHGMSQVDRIYLLSHETVCHSSWVARWSKIRGIYDRIDRICGLLSNELTTSDDDLVPITFIRQSDAEGNAFDSDQLNPPFIHSLLLKTIFIEMKHGRDEREKFIELCQARYTDDPYQLSIVDEFSRDYRPNRAIWWYTRKCFVRQILNRMLGSLDSDLIYRMGFFIRDLHQQILGLYHEQLAHYHEHRFRLYHAQQLSIQDFGEVRHCQGGLMIFNTFVLAKKKRDYAMTSVKNTAIDEDHVHVLFVITMDPIDPVVPFADIRNHNYLKGRKEMLIPMHAHFRVEDIIGFQETPKFFEVHLTIVSKNDLKAIDMIHRIEDTVLIGPRWNRLGMILVSLAQWNKAEEFYRASLLEATNAQDESICYYHLGLIKEKHGAYDEAIQYFKQELAIKEKLLSTTDPSLISVYDRIGAAYDVIGDPAHALIYYIKVLDVQKKILPHNHPSLAVSFSNIGRLYDNMEEYAKALSYFEEALAIRQKSDPENHSDLAISYNNIAGVYDTIGEHLQALLFYKKALDMWERSSFDEDSLLAIVHNNIGAVYDNMGEYSQALLYYDESLTIREKTLPANHSALATSYNNIAGVYDTIGKSAQALIFYKKALRIWQTNFSQDYALLATVYSNIARAFDHLQDYSQALLFYRTSLDIWEQTLPAHHRLITTCYSNIGSTYQTLGQYSLALSYYTKLLVIQEISLPANHSDLAGTYNNIGSVYTYLKQYLVALPYLEKAFDILTSTLPAEHPEVQFVQHSIETVKKQL